MSSHQLQKKGKKEIRPYPSLAFKSRINLYCAPRPSKLPAFFFLLAMATRISSDIHLRSTTPPFNFLVGLFVLFCFVFLFLPFLLFRDPALQLVQRVDGAARVAGPAGGADDAESQRCAAR
jgi:hypothetical protein